MADAHFGGGGSVQWTLQVDDDERDDPVKKTEHTAKPEKGCTCRGVDKVIHGTHFGVAVKVPGIKSERDFIKWLTGDGDLTVRDGAASFRLPIQSDPDQITVRWD